MPTFDFIFSQNNLKVGWLVLSARLVAAGPADLGVGYLTVPAKVTCHEGWFSFINSFSLFGTSVVNPRASQESLWPLGILLIHSFDPRAPWGTLGTSRGSFGTFGPPGVLHEQRPPWLARDADCIRIVRDSGEHSYLTVRDEILELAEGKFNNIDGDWLVT